MKTTKTRSAVFTKLKTNTKYFFKVRAYKKYNNKYYYSKYSSVKAIKLTNYLMDIYSPYNSDCYTDCSNGGEYMYMGGDKYSHGFRLDNRGRATFNLKSKYGKISFVAGPEDGESAGTLEIYSDNSLIWNYKFNEGDLPRSFTVDIDYAAKLEFVAPDYWGCIDVANIKLYK